jgi:acyl carrier protein
MKNDKSKDKKATGAGGGKTFDAGQIKNILVGKLATRMGVPASAIDAKAPLASYGLDSLESVSLMVDLEKELGRRVDPTLLWQHPHLESLAQRLAEDAPPEPPTKRS